MLGALPYSPVWALWVGTSPTTTSGLLVPQGSSALRIPPAHHSWALSMGAPHAVFCPVQDDSHHYIPLAPATPLCSLAHRTHRAATAFGISWLQNGASVALLGPEAPALPHKCNAMGCRSHTHLCRNHQCTQVPKGPALCQSAIG